MSGGGSKRQQETEAEREVARIAAEKWAYYTDTFRDIENWAMSQAQTAGTASNVARTTGIANVDAQAGVAGQFREAGINPNASQANRYLTQQEQVGGLVASNAGGRAVLGANDQYINRMSNLAAIGQGNEATAITGMNRLANRNFNQTQQDLTNAFKNRSLNQQAVGLPIGIGASAYANSLGNQRPNAYQPVGGNPYDDYNTVNPYEGYT
jgi:hypothetical protein